ncbi:carboxypeptidase regulatory-like domain-containing protein [Fictibacillus nanhaiensis]|uniref:carboxypeptidase regulatory-like domain-containing protein n=1 Tax=Fictibacillus nanhaiensis TaxID=742169 RepID=UPI003C1AAA3D
MPFPSNIQFTPLSVGGQPYFDVVGDESPATTDLVGNAQFPSFYVAYDSTNVYFRIRLNDDPRNNALTAFRNFAWGVLINTTGVPGTYNWLLTVNGNLQRLELIQNTIVQFNSWTDQAEGTNGQGAPNFSQPIVNFDYARVTPADSSLGGNPDFFLDFFLPVSVLFSFLGINASSPLQLISFTSANANNYNKDSLRTSEGFQFQNALSNPITPEEVNVQAKLAVSKQLISGPTTILAGESATYTARITLSNSGKSAATTVFVRDVLGLDLISNFTLINVGSGNAVYDSVSRTLSWNVGNLAAGTQTTLTFSVTGIFTTAGSRTLETATTSGIDNFTGKTLPVSAATTVISVQTTGGIVGSVKDGSTGLPLTGVSVLLQQGVTTIGITTTNGNGEYSFTGLIPGSYTVTFSYPNYATAVRGATVTSGNISRVELLLNPLPATVNGTVVGTGFGPLQNAVVRLTDTSGVEVATATTDALGQYSISGVIPGHYTVSVTATNFQSASRGIDLAPNETETADFTLAINPAGISGTVTDTNGGTISGAIVEVLNETGIVIASTTTNGAGLYSLNNLAGGTYRVRFSAASFGTQLLGTTLTAGQTTTLNAALPPNTGILTGIVRDAGTNAPLSGASIRVINSSGIIIAQTSSNGGGEYVVEQLPPGVYSITFSVNGYGTVIVGATIQSDTTTTVSASLSRIVGLVTGTVTSNVGSPISGAVVELYQNNILVGSTVTDANGFYTINNLIPGSYTQVVTAPDFSSNTTGVIIQENNTTSIQVQLQPNPGTLTGLVVTNGTPLAGATIVVRESGSGTVVSRTVADDQGRYTVTNLVPGTYAVTASQDNYQTLALGAIINSNQTTNVSFNLAPNPAAINGTVFNSVTGTPITGASIEIRILNLNGTTIASAFTDPSGNYTVSNLATGTYAVVVSAAGFQTNTATVLLTAGETETTNIALAPSPGSISGNVTGSGGPINGATIRITDPNGLTILTTISDAEGNYLITGLAPGSYNVVVSATGFQTNLTGAIVQPNLITICNVDLPPNPGTIEGQITPAFGGGTIQLFTADNILISSATTAPGGVFRFDSVAPGQYTITASLASYQTAVAGVSVFAGQTSAVSLNLQPNPASVSGQIRSTSGTPIKDAIVQILDANETIIGIGTTDSNGNYSIGNLPPGTFQVSITAENFSSLIAGVTTTPGLVISGANYQLTPNPGAIAGQVTDENGNPLSGVTIIVRTTNGAFIGSVVTSPAGNYIVSNLAPGSYTVTGNKDNFSTVTTGAIVTSNQTAGANIRLSSIVGDVSGQVVDQDGFPVTGNNIQIRLLHASGQLLRSFLANPDGTFIILGLSPGRYFINVTADTYSANTVPVDVVAGINVQVTVPLTLLPATVNGQVVNANSGAPIPGSVILVTTVNGIFISRSVSGSNGEFTISNLPPGNAIISTSADNFGSNTATLFLNPNETKNITLRLSPTPGSLSGFVTDVITGNPIPGTIVIVSTDTGAVITTAVADQFGQFLVPDLNPGSYRATATADGYTTNLASFTILPSTTSVLSFALSPVPGAISGVISDRQSGQPLAGVSVIARQLSAAGPIVGTTLTNSDGQYVFAALSPNSFTIVASLQDYGSETASTVVQPNQTSTLNILLTNSPGAVTGIVTDEDSGDVLSNVLIRLFTNTGVLISSVLTDPTGSYFINGFSAGQYRLVAVDPRYQREEITFTAGPGITASVNITLNRILGTIAGKITDAQTNGPLVGSVVLVFRTSDTDPIARAITDSLGNYVVTSLPPDTYNVVATAVNYARNSTGATVLAEQTTITNIALIPNPATIRGTVRSTSGDPIIDATIKIVNLNGVVAGTATSSADGTYEISNLAEGTYTLVVTAPLYANVNGGITLRPGEIRSNVNFTLEPNPGNVQGVIRNAETGDPVLGAVLSVINSIGIIVRTTTTNSEGAYLITGLAPNTYTISADKFGFAPNTVGAIVTSNQTTNASILISAIKGDIQGSVVDAAGNPIINHQISIKLTDTNGVIIRTLITNNAGEFAFLDVQPGEYLLNITAQGYQAKTVPVIVVADQVTQVIINLSSAFGAVRGTVVERETGNPINGARITVTDIANIVVATGITDSNGQFFITNLALGSLNVSASKTGFGSTTKGVIVQDGQITETRLELVSEPGNLTGVILNQLTGNPIPGASIRVIDSTQSTVISLLSADNGQYSVSGLATGRYQVNVTAINFSSNLSGVIILANDTTVDNVALNPDPGSLAGNVTSLTTGQPIPNTSIEVRAFGVAGPVIAVTVTNNEGRYLVSNLPPGVYTIVANALGFGTAEASEEVLSNQVRIQDLVMLSQISAVRGRVTDEGGQPLADTLISLAKDGASVVVQVQTDIDGRYFISQIDAGSYTIVALNTDFQQSLQSFTVAPGDTATINFVLIGNPGTIAGRVTDRETGLAIPGAVVFIFNSNSEPITSDVADEGGNYSVTGLAPGTYSVRATATRYASNARSITVTAGAVTTADYQLDGNPVTIRGSVTSDTNLLLQEVLGMGSDVLGIQAVPSADQAVILAAFPVINAVVSVFDENGLLVGRGATGPNGNYVIGYLPAGTLTVTGSAPGYEDSTQTVTALPGDDLTVNFELSSGSVFGSLQGIVINAFTRLPVSGATVILREGVSTFETVTGADGSFSFVRLAAGVYTITVAQNGYRLFSGSVTIVGGETTELTIILLPNQVSNGVIVLINGSPLCIPGSGCPTIFTLVRIDQNSGCTVLAFYVDSSGGPVRRTLVIGLDCASLVTY